jgi:hypothetical protein
MNLTKQELMMNQIIIDENEMRWNQMVSLVKARKRMAKIGRIWRNKK